MKLVIVAAPSASIYDQALPIVSSLRKSHPNLEILCLYPKPGSIVGVRPGWATIQKLESLGATSAYPITPARWMTSSMLTVRGKFTRFLARASRLSFPDLIYVGRALGALISLGLVILSWIPRGQTAKKFEALALGTDFVLWDYEMIRLGKKWMEPLTTLLKTVPSFSIRHGIVLPSSRLNLEQLALSELEQLALIKNVTFLAMSKNDILSFRKISGVADDQIQSVGVFRHHRDWIQEIAFEGIEGGEKTERNTLLVVPRPFTSPNGYLPLERVLGYLEDIKLVANRLNLRVIVKPHPKEPHHDVYSKVFGLASEGVTWEISDDHLAVLAKKAQFAVTFFSGTCVDFTAWGVPTIERLNLVGRPGYDTPSSMRDSTGAPVFEYRLNGLVLGSSTSEEFFRQVDEVSRNRKKMMSQLRKAYSRVFISPPTSPEVLAQQISDTVMNS